jgi:hypothetical protein
MNIFVRRIGHGDLPSRPSFSARKLCVEDNIGESIHIHVRNARLELTIDDFLKFSDCIESSLVALSNDVVG